MGDYAYLSKIGNKLLGEVKNDFASTCIYITQVVILDLHPFSRKGNKTIDCRFLLNCCRCEMEQNESTSNCTLPKERGPWSQRRSHFAKTPGVRNDAKLLCWSVLTISRSTAQLNFHTIVKVTVLASWACIYIAFVLADETVRLIATEKPEL